MSVQRPDGSVLAVCSYSWSPAFYGLLPAACMRQLLACYGSSPLRTEVPQGTA